MLFGLLSTTIPSFGQSLQNSPRKQLGLSKDSLATRYQPQIDRLLQLIQQRLIIQNDIARWKWNQNSPVEVPEREQELLEQLRQQAPSYGLDPDVVVVFFQWQIFAGKLIQVNNFQTWQREGVQSFDNVPDLNQTLRPQLDKLNPEILSALVPLSPALSCPIVQQLVQSRAHNILRGDGIDKTVRRVAIAPLIELKGTSCQSVSRLDMGKNLTRVTAQF
ncbi:MAG: gamma subclass chorismate mutase AroQ [Iphinoe sp. HA4291-MV1]|nr:gamma subclass chorismate mutase AroQ [Iphinoe sp. HA4291-MV1]